LPLLPISRAPSVATTPVASATPGTPLIWAISDAGTVAGTCSPWNSPSSTLGFAVTATSVSE
jgi:hypothetical protein